MFEAFDVLGELERQKAEIVNIENVLCEPLLYDVGFIEGIYNLSKERRDITKTECKQLFIMLVLLFYSPMKLVVGTKIKKRIMDEMCRVTKCSQPLLSTYSRNLVFFYQHYTNFRIAVDETLTETCNILIGGGIDKKRVKSYISKFSMEG